MRVRIVGVPGRSVPPLSLPLDGTWRSTLPGMHPHALYINRIDLYIYVQIDGNSTYDSTLNSRSNFGPTICFGPRSTGRIAHLTIEEAIIDTLLYI